MLKTADLASIIINLLFIFRFLCLPLNWNLKINLSLDIVIVSK